MAGQQATAPAALPRTGEERRRQVHLTGVRAVKALPDRIEIHRETGDTHVLRCGIGAAKILAKDLSRHLARRRQPIATFLYYPDGAGATVLVEEREDRCTLMISEG